MKKTLGLFLILLSTTAFSQIQFGPKAGINFSNANGWDDPNVKTSTLVGFHVGGFVAFKIGKLAIQPELLYSTQGFRYDSIGVKNDYKLNYFNIPVMLKYRTKGGFYVETGPQLGFKVGEDYGSSGDDYIKNGDFSWCAGLGFHSAGGFGVGARYNVGLSKLSSGSAAFDDPNFKSGVFQVSLFYSFFGNKKKKESQ
jgi:Outer membrane protein beta-barrel domain